MPFGISVNHIIMWLEFIHLGTIELVPRLKYHLVFSSDDIT